MTDIGGITNLDQTHRVAALEAMVRDLEDRVTVLTFQNAELETALTWLMESLADEEVTR